jgi:hypothetical protein
MRTLKHIGKIAKTKENVLVVFRTLPGDSGSALVLPTAGLSDLYHDAVNQLVETIQAQESFEFGEILFTRMFPDVVQCYVHYVLMGCYIKYQLIQL